MQVDTQFCLTVAITVLSGIWLVIGLAWSGRRVIWEFSREISRRELDNARAAWSGYSGKRPEFHGVPMVLPVDPIPPAPLTYTMASGETCEVRFSDQDGNEYYTFTGCEFKDAGPTNAGPVHTCEAKP